MYVPFWVLCFIGLFCVLFVCKCVLYYCHRGGTVVKVLGYKSEGRWFDSRWCHWNFSLT